MLCLILTEYQVLIYIKVASIAINRWRLHLLSTHQSAWGGNELTYNERVKEAGSVEGGKKAIINTSYQELPFGSGDDPDKLKRRPDRAILNSCGTTNILLETTHFRLEWRHFRGTVLEKDLSHQPVDRRIDN